MPPACPGWFWSTVGRPMRWAHGAARAKSAGAPAAGCPRLRQTAGLGRPGPSSRVDGCCSGVLPAPTPSTTQDDGASGRAPPQLTPPLLHTSAAHAGGGEHDPGQPDPGGI